MKKKSILARLGIMALVCMLATTSLMSGTLAKYTEVKSAIGTAIVAKWNPSATIGGTSTTNGAFSLRDTVTYPSSVASGVTSDVICPGMSGKISVTVNAGDSDVPIDYVVRMFYTNKETSEIEKSDFAGLSFAVSGGEAKPLSEVPFTPKNNVDKVAQYMEIKTGTLKPNDNAVADVTWDWPYEVTGDSSAKDKANKDDTDFGKAADQFEFHIQVVLTQASPSANAVA